MKTIDKRVKVCAGINLFNLFYYSGKSVYHCLYLTSASWPSGLEEAKGSNTDPGSIRAGHGMT